MPDWFWPALGVVVPSLGSVFVAGWLLSRRLGALSERVNVHGAQLSNGLAADVKANARAIADLAKTQAVVIEHQRGQDRRLDEVLSGLKDLSRGLGNLQCLGTTSRCGPARIITSGD